MTLTKSKLTNDPDNVEVEVEVEVELIHAYMAEGTGRPIQVWELYTSLAEGLYDKLASLTCKGILIFGDGVSDVAKFRSLWLAQSLKAEGVDLSSSSMEKIKITLPPAEKGIAVLPPSFAKQSSAPMPAPMDSTRKEVVDAK